jgi:hypothetical protein
MEQRKCNDTEHQENKRKLDIFFLKPEKESVPQLINDEKIERVKTFKSLGVIISQI